MSMNSVSRLSSVVPSAASSAPKLPGEEKLQAQGKDWNSTFISTRTDRFIGIASVFPDLAHASPAEVARLLCTEADHFLNP